MSKAGRWGLIALAVVVVGAAFLIARPGDENSDSGNQAASTATETSPTATAPSAPKPPPDGPTATVIELKDHEPVDGVVDIDTKKGDPVRIVVRSDVADDIHIHGYDIEESVAPGKPARFQFDATIEGVFEIESHEAEHAGKDALIARLVVEPS